MKLLAFETATEACSVALWIDGEVRERFELAPRRHAELALPWAEALLAEAGIARSALDAIAVGRGPGAFTGVRLAIAVAQGIALALARPVVAISTLATLAAGVGAGRDRPAGAGERGSESLSSCMTSAPEQAGLESDSGPLSPSRILASIDARMGEVYAGAFVLQHGRLAALSPETVSAPDAVALPDAHGGWQGVGTGFAAAGGLLAQRLQPWLAGVDAAALPHAADLARLAAAAFARGEALPPERIEPAYLRDRVALTLVQQRAAREPRA